MPHCWLTLITKMWDSPALARHLFALTLLTHLHERVEQTCLVNLDLNVAHQVWQSLPLHTNHAGKQPL